MKSNILFVLFFYVNLTFACVYFEGPNGPLLGRLASIPGSNKTFYAFQEIPYAQPPIEDLRFQLPQPVSNWTEIRDARSNTKICHQIGSSSSPLETEDCLYLNVYTPQLPSGDNKKGLPVMVFIHGGGFINGDATYTSYGPNFFMDRGVIIVTLNYRLGVFGFLSTQDSVIPGNLGFKDQVFALQWVQQSISLFGGDPEKVTIFGQSAGAASVGYHLVSEKSKGLYRAAILESGSVISPWAYQREAKTYAFKLATYLKSTAETSTELLDLLKNTSAEDINEAAEQILKEETYDNQQMYQGYYFGPILEVPSPEAFITEKMYDLIAAGKANRVPIIMGINSEECSTPGTTAAALSVQCKQFDSNLPALVSKDLNVASDKLEEVGGAIRKIYVEDLFEDRPSFLLKYFSDQAFDRSIIMHATLQSQFSNVYFYEFDYDGFLGNNSINIPGADFVGHSEELPYMWRMQSNWFNNYDVDIPQEDLDTRQRLLQMWTNFAKELVPIPKQNTLLNSSWDIFKIDTSFTYLRIGQSLKTDTSPKCLIYPAWPELYLKYGSGSYDTY